MTLPAFEQAKTDKAIFSLPGCLYLHLLDQLNPLDFLPVKQAALAKLFDCDERSVQRALNVLVQRGVLFRANVETGPSSAQLYKLVYPRMP